jgi:hypothetical protein
MRRLILLTVGLLVLVLATAARAGDVQLRLRMGFPAILPPLVEVQPGIRVVQDFDEEVFFTGGFYWVQRDGNWYRARDHRGTWRYVRPGGIPAGLTQHESGHYRRWQHDEHRAWPAAQHAGRDARHWRAGDYRERRQPPEEQRQGAHEKSQGHGDDRRGHRD